MQGYGIRDVERLLRLSRSTIRALIRARLVAPLRGARNAFVFSFQDLVAFRTAQALLKARVPQRRIARAMREMRRVADSGQFAFDFGSEPKRAAFKVTAPPPEVPGADDWFESALALEDQDIAEAVKAYGRALGADPRHLDARINLGWLLHEVGMLKEAEKIYRTAPKEAFGDALLQYNLAVLLEDLKRPREALAAYEAAVAADPALADGHYNLALLHEQLGHAQDALRHMAQYRRLARPK